MIAVLRNPAVIMGALGYFVDMFDMFLFNVVRVDSLVALGYDRSETLAPGIFLMNAQTAGFLLGGLLFGVLGDRLGRRSILFGSITIYSLATLANAFAPNVEVYALLRFIAGIGLAGELGAAITLVSEALPREVRGYGTTAVAAFGVLGGVSAGLVGGMLPWRGAYILGGVMGLILLAVRLGLQESKLFTALTSSASSSSKSSRGSLKLLFSNPSRVVRYLACIGLGAPIFFVSSILIAFTPELSKEMDSFLSITAADAVLYSFLGVGVGDVICGALSQKLRSRKKVIGVWLVANFALAALFLSQHQPSMFEYRVFCFLQGVTTGYWALLIAFAAEQFGTNLRATAATSIPNFVRGTAIPTVLLFRSLTPEHGALSAALVVGGVTTLIALVSLAVLSETFGRSLEFLEERRA